MRDAFGFHDSLLSLKGFLYLAAMTRSVAAVHLGISSRGLGCEARLKALQMDFSGARRLKRAAAGERCLTGSRVLPMNLPEARRRQGSHGTYHEEIEQLLATGIQRRGSRDSEMVLNIVAPLYHGVLHSHAAVTAVPHRRSRRGLTSLSALFHAQWPRVQLVDILTAVAKVGFITPPQKTAGPVANEKSCGYS